MTALITPAQKYAKYGYGKGNWWYNTTSGVITQATGIQQIINVDGPGLSLAGPFPTQADAQAFKTQFPPKGPAKAISGAVSATEGVSSFLGQLSNKNTWVRIAEVVLGLGLLIVGLSQLAKGTPVGNAATKVAKAAAIL
jgi:hypothetical protein